MDQARQLVFDRLTQAFTGPPVVAIDVLPYSRQIDPPTRPTAMLRLDEIVPSPAAAGAREGRFTLVLVGALTDPYGAADDELDAAREDVLHAIETKADGIAWTSAKRAVYGEPDPTQPAYDIGLVVTFGKE